MGIAEHSEERSMFLFDVTGSVTGWTGFETCAAFSTGSFAALADLVSVVFQYYLLSKNHIFQIDHNGSMNVLSPYSSWPLCFGAASRPASSEKHIEHILEITKDIVEASSGTSRRSSRASRICSGVTNIAKAIEHGPLFLVGEDFVSLLYFLEFCFGILLVATFVGIGMPLLDKSPVCLPYVIVRGIPGDSKNLIIVFSRLSHLHHHRRLSLRFGRVVYCNNHSSRLENLAIQIVSSFYDIIYGHVRNII